MPRPVRFFLFCFQNDLRQKLLFLCSFSFIPDTHFCEFLGQLECYRIEVQVTGVSHYFFLSNIVSYISYLLLCSHSTSVCPSGFSPQKQCTRKLLFDIFSSNLSKEYGCETLVFRLMSRTQISICFLLVLCSKCLQMGTLS